MKLTKKAATLATTKKNKIKNKKQKQAVPIEVEEDRLTNTLEDISLQSQDELDTPQSSKTTTLKKNRVKKMKEERKKRKEKKLKKKVEEPRNVVEVEGEEEEFDPVVSDFLDSEPEYSGRSSGAEVHGGEMNGGNVSGEDDDNDSFHSAGEESDSSEDEVEPRNTIGDVPLEFYKDEEHIGYDITGKKIKRKERKDQLAKFLANVDDKRAWQKIWDEYNDEEVEIEKDELKTMLRIIQGKTPHDGVDPYPDYKDWFVWKDKGHPLSNAPEPKRRFTPSKWEAKRINALVRAIREGRIKFDIPKEVPRVYDLWSQDSTLSGKLRSIIYAPKTKLPGHEASYNPSPEYLFTQEEHDAFQLMYDEDKPDFIPRRYTSFRSIPAYDKAVKDVFSRCLDLYLCPRAKKKRVNIDPESLKNKDTPKRETLRPFPTTCYLEYEGHTGAVVSISTEASGQWIASGSKDGTVRIWEVATGRCILVWEFDDAIQHVAWNPLPQLPILAVSVGQDVFIIDTGLGSEEEQKGIEGLLQIAKADAYDESGTGFVSWLPDDKHGGLRLRHFKTVSSVEWHRRGDYFSTVMPAGESYGVMIHQLSKKNSQKFSFKLHGLPVSTAFHPTRSIFFIATKKNVRVYDLLKEKLIKKLETQLREVSCIAIHPGGDNVLVGSRDGKWCWFDMDLSSKPYKTLKSHTKDVVNVTYHRSYPIFASCSEDGLAKVYHGMVYSDLNQNPLIVPLIKLIGPSSSKGRGVLDCKFHPRQPWLFTAGADSIIRLYCH